MTFRQRICLVCAFAAAAAVIHSAVSTAQPDPNPQVQQWEYKIVTDVREFLPEKDVAKTEPGQVFPDFKAFAARQQKMLNAAGKEGWELVYYHHQAGYHYFKRPARK